MLATADWTLDRTGPWTRRVPTLVLTLGPAVVAATVIAGSWNQPSGLSGDIGQVTSWAEFLPGIPVGLGLGAILLSWFAPRLGAWFMAVGVFPPLLANDPTTQEVSWFPLLGWAWSAIVILDLVLVLRQRSRSQWIPMSDPDTTRWRADHHLGARMVATVVLGAAIVVGFVLYLNWRADTLDLASRAVPVEATVETVDTFFDSVIVNLHGDEHEFFVNDAAAYPVGSTITVYTDPTGQEDPYGAEDADPGGWADMGVPIGAGLLLLWIALVEIGRRRHRVESLAMDGGPEFRALVRSHPVHDGLEVFAIDDTAGESPLVYLPAIEQLVPATGREPTGLRGGFLDLVDFIRFQLGIPDRDPGGMDDRQLDPDDAPDQVDNFDDDTEFPLSFAYAGGLEEVIVVGLVNDGSVCVLRVPGNDALVLASVRPARDRWTLKTVLAMMLQRMLDGRIGRMFAGPAGRHAAGSPAATVHRSAEPIEDTDEPGLLIRHAIRLLRLSSWCALPVLAALGGFAMPWFLEGDGLGFATFGPAFMIANLAVWWWDLGRPPVVASRWGLRLTGGWVDHLLLPHEITDVRHLLTSVVVELGEDGEYEFPRDPMLSASAQLHGLDKIVSMVERARERGRAGQLAHWESHWPRRLPSSTTLVAVAVFVIWAVAGY